MTNENYRAQLIGSEHAEGDVTITHLTGAGLDQTFIGKFIGRNEGNYNRVGRIRELVPVLTDPKGLWLATIQWGQTPDKPAQVERIQIPFSQHVEIVEISEG